MVEFSGLHFTACNNILLSIMRRCGFGSYETVKYVQIEDARLGALRLLSLLTITSYVVIVEMCQLGGYLESNSVVGVVKFSLQQPTHNDCDPFAEGCTNAFDPLDALEYCEQANGYHTGYAGNIYPCQIYEAGNVKIVRETSLIVWTRASIYNQSLICDGSIESGSMTCPNTYENQDNFSQPFYIAQSEAFTVSLEHTVTASRFCEHNGRSNKKRHVCSAQASKYQGRLHSTHEGLCREEFLKSNSFTKPQGSRLQSNAPCFIGTNRTSSDQDLFSLHVLLQAAGASLDDCMDDNMSNTDCITYRESGATLLLHVVWNDIRPFQGLVEPFYYYSPQLLEVSYEESLPFYHPYHTSRTLMRAHGIKIAVLLTGDFHQFQILPFLITLTAALGLLAIATTVVDSLMLYVLPKKKHYQQVKYEMIQEESMESSSQDDYDYAHNDNLEFTSDVYHQNEYEWSNNKHEPFLPLQSNAIDI